jgi:protein dithiol oxidoreductase (disulfide-forming)
MLRRTLVLLLGLSLSAASMAAGFVEGKDFFRLKAQVPTQVAKGKVEVVEVFQYGCIHCAHMEPFLATWKKTMPASAQLRQVHATYDNQGLRNLARAHLALIALGAGDKAHSFMFKAVESGQPPSTDLAVIAKSMAQFGVKPETFLATANSFGVSQKLKQNEALIPRYEIGGTPEIIIAGKYRVTAVAGQPQTDMLKIVDFVIQKEAIERAALGK